MTTSPTTPAPLTRLSLQNFNRSVDHVVNRRERFDITPPYQRGSVWGVARRRNLVKSLLLGLPVGAITLNDRGFQADGKDMGVVDGKQRVEALWAFVDSEFAIPAFWLAAESVVATEPIELEGRVVPGVRHSGTSAVFQRHFSHSPIQMIEASVVGLAAEAEVFLLINAGGVAQTDADLANAADFRELD